MITRLIRQSLFTIAIISGLNFLFPLNVKSQLSGISIADKYGLVVADTAGKFVAVPVWLQEADMFTMYKGVWKDYKFTLVDTVMTRIVRKREGNSPCKITEHYPVETIGSFDGSLVRGVSLISHVPHCKQAFDEAHKQGIKVIPYLHFTDIHSLYADQDVFLFQHPEILLKDADGKWVHLPMDGSERIFRFLTCANNPSYWKLSLAYVKKVMDWGADGIFIDNVSNRQPCFATQFDGRNPEFPPYIHEHLFPDSTHNYAWDCLLKSIRGLVKSYGEDKIVILNSGIGTRFQKNGDCCMWESFIFSWAWDGRKHTWDDVKKHALENAWYLNEGKRITALSFLNPKRKEVKDDAFWAFSSARMVDYIWWADLNDTGAEALYQAHLGKSLGPYKELNEIVYKVFENGVIVLNNSTEDRTVELILPAEFKPAILQDLYDNSHSVKVKFKKIKVTVSKQAARVYLSPHNLS
jgi:hypothetical protein